MENNNSKKKNVAVFCGSLYRGGSELVTIYLAEGLKRRGYNTEIITCSKRDYEYEEPKGIKRHVLICSEEKKFFLKMVHRLRRVLKTDNIDMLLVISCPLCVYAIPATTGLDVKVIVSERNDPTHFAGKRITKWLSYTLMKHADGFVFQTHDAKAYFSKKLNNCGVVIYNPVFTKNLPEVFCGSRSKRIVAVGRLSQQKNHRLLIEAFSECDKINQEYRLVIYGEGKLREELEKMISNLHMEEKIELPGNVSDVCEKIKDASLFVLSSDFEGMPNALIEAMAIGIPCISTDCPIGGPSELIQSGMNGVLIPIGDKAKLKENMMHLLLSQSVVIDTAANAMRIRELLSEKKILMEWITYIERVFNK